MPNQYPNGIGGTLGNSLVTCRPLSISGAVWYVSSATGTDAGGTAGRNREKPLASVSQAITNSSEGDIIVFLSDHDQTISGPININKQLTLVGEGSVAGVPEATFRSSANQILFDAQVAGTQFINIKFEESTAVNTASRIEIGNTDIYLDQIYMECGANDAHGVRATITGSRLTIRNSTFISTSTDIADQPGIAVSLEASGLADMRLEGVTFSAGTVGFANYFAFSAQNAIERFVGQDISLLLGADMKLNESTTGRLNLQTVTGGSRVEW